MYRYLTHRCVQSNSPSRINNKQVYFSEGVFYFKTDGLKDYLRIAKYTLGRTNLREELVKYGCVEGEVTWERKDKSIATIQCWKKDEDEALKNMARFFDEVIDEDADILSLNKLNKEEKEGDKGYEAEAKF